MRLVRVTITASERLSQATVSKEVEKCNKKKPYYESYKKAYDWWVVQHGYSTTVPYYEYRTKQYLEKLEKAVEEKDYRELSGTLNHHNTLSRAIFTHRTGVKLPSTDKGTLEALQKWVGKKGMAEWMVQEEYRQTDNAVQRREDEKQQKMETIAPYFNRIPAANKADDKLIKEYLLTHKFSSDDAFKKAIDKLTKLVKGDHPLTDKEGTWVWYKFVEEYMAAGYSPTADDGFKHPTKQEWWDPPKNGWLAKYAKWLYEGKKIKVSKPKVKAASKADLKHLFRK